MTKIHILSSQVINQIAAGEVVERPASIVKELTENSIDASSSFIVIEVSKGGTEMIKITDNGNGMNKEDAKLCFEKHATSKISETEDLNHLRTLGFRGEALASIASVSFVELKTKEKKSLSGTLMELEGGEIKKNTEAGCPDGTQFIINNIFFNTPARRKFLKSENTEYSHILGTVTNFALSYPNIHFKFIHNNKVVFDLPKSENLLNRISSLLGSDFSKNLIPVFLGHKDINIEGFTSNLQNVRNTRNNQYLFINGREIKNSYISHAVKASYESLLPYEKFPAYILKIQINPQLADFNIHPRKTEVRFSKQEEIYYYVKQAIKTSLNKNSLIPDFSIGNNNSNNESVSSSPRFHSAIKDKNYLPLNKNIINESLNFNYEIASSWNKIDFQKEEKSSLKPVSQISNSYIVCENSEGIIIVDQHAAHERIMFMKLKDNALNQQKSIQSLLIPLQIELSYKEVKILEENIKNLNELGFELEFFGGNTFNISAVPSFLNKDDIVEIIKGVIDDLSSETPIKGVDEKKDNILHYVACHSAVKFGRALTTSEQEKLLYELEKAEMKYTCPHGRPTMLKLTFQELEKKFGRTVKDLRNNIL